jgi:thiamine-monophosphate kinase
LLSEFELIRKYFDRPAPNAALGVGDDAALLRPGAGMELAVSTDLLLEGRHFRTGADPSKLGHKSLAVNLSDMAAMGAAPRWATLALALPSADKRWLAGFSKGFFALARRFGVELVGGDTTRGPLSICVTILGEVPKRKALRRDGARPGDEIWVSGELGGAAIALARSSNAQARSSSALARPGDAAAAKRLHTPEPRVSLGLRLRGIASAAIDVSDGFAQDLGHILERSGVGAVVHYDMLPKHGIENRKLERRCVLSGGDDYELIFTAHAGTGERVKAIARALNLRLTRVGSIGRRRDLRILDANGRQMKVERGFDHFSR